MRFYLHTIIIYCILVARNYCRGERRKFSTIRKKTVESVSKALFKIILQFSDLS